MLRYDDAPAHKLKEGLNIEKLLSGEVDELVLDDEESQFRDVPDCEREFETLYEYDDYKDHVNLDVIKCDVEELLLAETAFEAIGLKMTDVTPDGKVKKQVVTVGTEPVPHGAMVYVHYDFYLEMKEVPFDSTYLRSGKPERLKLGENNHIPGFEIAVQSMRVGEKSQFLIHPDYAFGKMGAPPRIPAEATILAIIHVEEVVDCGLANEIEKLSWADAKVFSIVRPLAEAVHKLAKHSVQWKRIGTAIHHYQSEEKLLLNCPSKDKEEETLRKQMLLKIYVNLTICYNHPQLKDFRRALVYAAHAFKIDPEAAARNAKLFYNRGRARCGKSDFKLALEDFKKAQSIEPNNKEVWGQFQTVCQKIAEADKLEKEISIRAFGGIGKTGKEGTPEPETAKKVMDEPETAKKVIDELETAKKVMDEPETRGTEGDIKSPAKCDNVEGWQVEAPVDDDTLANEDKDMVELIKGFLKDFAESSTSSYSLGHGFSPAERRCYKKLSEKFGLIYEEYRTGRLRRNVVIRKPF